MPGTDNHEGEREIRSLSHLSALSSPPSVSDRLYVRKRAPIAPRLMVMLGALLAIFALLFLLPPSVWDGWMRHNEPMAAHVTDASTSVPHKPLKGLRKAPIRATHAKDLSEEPPYPSANDLALGFAKARWGMTMNDAKALWPLVQPYSQIAFDPAGPHPSPIHDEDMLLLEHYAYAGCIFSVKFKFKDNKLFSVQMDADGSDAFQECHSAVLASLTRQYGEKPLFPYRGYSLHCSWSGPSTTVLYNEIQGAVIEVVFSASG
jgi:hypothetical protein